MIDQTTLEAWDTVLSSSVASTGALQTLLVDNLRDLLDPAGSGQAAPSLPAVVPADYVNWRTSVQSADAADSGDYATSFAGSDASTEISGGVSTHATDNRLIVDGAAGDQDVLVLATGVASNDIITWNGTFNNGTVTVVNFGTAGAVNAAAANAAGTDFLDFTAYGAEWLGAATLAADGTVGSVWGQAGAVNSAALTTAAATGTSSGIGAGGTWAEGGKYITLTRVDANTTTYKAELWTVVGTDADAYLATPSATADTAQLIGYVDLGQAIGTATAQTDPMAHIDF